MEVIFFATPLDFRNWLHQHHLTQTELWVGFYKKGTGQPSITWPESVDEALCFGWIDGLRKSIDETSYKIRFTPRKKGSIWSAVNIKRVEVLTAEGRMFPAGLKAFAGWNDNPASNYSIKNRPDLFEEPYLSRFREANQTALEFFESQPVSYRRAAIFWVMSPKTEPTRLKRLDTLIEISAQQDRIPHLKRSRT